MFGIGLRSEWFIFKNIYSSLLYRKIRNCIGMCRKQRKGDMSDLRSVIFLKFVRFGANYVSLFTFAMSVLPNRYLENKDVSLQVRGNLRVCLLLLICEYNQHCCFYLSLWKCVLTKNIPYVLVNIVFTRFFICLMLPIELSQKSLVFVTQILT